MQIVISGMHKAIKVFNDYRGMRSFIDTTCIASEWELAGENSGSISSKFMHIPCY
jgi:hypothetical protein